MVSRIFKREAANILFVASVKTTGHVMPTTAPRIADFFAPSSIVGFFRSATAKISEKARRDRAYKTTYAQLDAMTDNDLADIGIARFMIADVAAEAAERA